MLEKKVFMFQFAFLNVNMLPRICFKKTEKTLLKYSCALCFYRFPKIKEYVADMLYKGQIRTHIFTA